MGSQKRWSNPPGGERYQKTSRKRGYSRWVLKGDQVPGRKRRKGSLGKRSKDRELDCMGEAMFIAGNAKSFGRSGEMRYRRAHSHLEAMGESLKDLKKWGNLVKS